MKRIRRGWALTKKSWALLNGHRELVRFPLYGGIATIILGLVFLGPGVSRSTSTPTGSACR